MSYDETLQRSMSAQTHPFQLLQCKKPDCEANEAIAIYFLDKLCTLKFDLTDPRGYYSVRLGGLGAMILRMRWADALIRQL